MTRKSWNPNQQSIFPSSRFCIWHPSRARGIARHCGWFSIFCLNGAKSRPNDRQGAELHLLRFSIEPALWAMGRHRQCVGTPYLAAQSPIFGRERSLSRFSGCVSWEESRVTRHSTGEIPHVTAPHSVPAIGQLETFPKANTIYCTEVRADIPEAWASVPSCPKTAPDPDSSIVNCGTKEPRG